jgi:phosphoribosyl 1,2-cyclic phosphodiesterase
MDRLAPGGRYPIGGDGGPILETPLRLKHPVETYGLRFVGRRWTVGLVACTGYMPEIQTALSADLLILNVVYREPRDEIHLALPDARQLITTMRPRLAVITHFGLTMLRARPWELAETLSRETSVRVMAARDRWRLDLDAELGGNGRPGS